MIYQLYAMETLGSQIGILLFIAIGIAIVYVINMAKKDKMDKDDKNTAIGCIVIAAFIIAFLCYYLS